MKQGEYSKLRLNDELSIMQKDICSKVMPVDLYKSIEGLNVTTERYLPPQPFTFHPTPIQFHSEFRGRVEM